jgi:hypothetical protein
MAIQALAKTMSTVAGSAFTNITVGMANTLIFRWWRYCLVDTFSGDIG